MAGVRCIRGSPLVSRRHSTEPVERVEHVFKRSLSSVMSRPEDQQRLISACTDLLRACDGVGPFLDDLTDGAIALLCLYFHSHWGTGVAFCHALHIFVPEALSETDLSHIHRGANDAIRRSNMRKFMRAITDYYIQKMKIAEDEMGLPNVTEIVRGSVADVRHTPAMPLQRHNGCLCTCVWRPTSCTLTPRLGSSSPFIFQIIFSSLPRIPLLFSCPCRAVHACMYQGGTPHPVLLMLQS